MSRPLRIKEYDLHEIIKDLVDAALEIDRPNKEKICKFIVNLVDNGGNKTMAAIDAGFGAKKGKDGKARTLDERKAVASTEGDRLLRNAAISSLYEKLLSHRFISTIFTKTFTKEHSANILYQIGMNTYETNPRQAIAAFKEASTLAGHYKDMDDSSDEEKQKRTAELIKAGNVIDAWKHAQNQVDSKKVDKEVEQVRVKSEVYN
ncbi:hypothetical protein [uncultured Paraglaciecola sp.]|uniref:hypothetical protein n=1 Tax=uncultured Paraglaciecola sp. TaxID=1765024 RepID=UPI002634571E|nr:hypothetical protein [uncultured Paraglaciecola sp.]